MGCLARLEEIINAHNSLVVNPEGMRSFWRPRRGHEDLTIMHLKKK